ncbi:MBOAT family O-acyltransferase [Flavobacterium sp. RHBU_24]|uniref:MBOAT family O-acyltransferase n=1 Tax=Flavobacterium sp. RHBU_24 TaxID=3391185 RepID=UPI003984A961
MLFNSLQFAVFFVIVFALYWLAGTRRLWLQNTLLVVASYYFYCSWNWRFGLLLAFSTLLDFYSARAIAASVRHKKAWLYTAITINLGLLAFFKYYNFFISSAAQLLESFGFNANVYLLSVVLPVGISFYTFHGLSYVIDVYKGRISPTANIVNYSLFVSFFPLLVAGPIERATHLLPQIQKPRAFDYPLAIIGMRQVLWGLFKKMVIADNCAYFVNHIFANYQYQPASNLVFGAFLFSFQIYGDFSGYTDIASGVSKLLGFNLLKNFNYPYFSRDIAEFWRRWHISLTSWFKDYVYIPLGGSRGSRFQTVRNVFIIFLVSGLWHGANFTFIAWGLLHAVYFLPLLLAGTNRKNTAIAAQGKIIPSFKEFINIVVTFSLVTIGWIFFRSATLPHAIGYCRRLFSPTLFSIPQFDNKPYALTVLLLVVAFITAEWLGRESDFAIEKTAVTWPRPLRWLFYCIMVFLLILFMSFSEVPFIYFQF